MPAPKGNQYAKGKATGRPKDDTSRLEEGWQAMMLEMAGEGCSEYEIRAKLKISHDLWDRWIAEDEEFSYTVKLCKAACRSKWEEMGRKMAFGQVDGNPTTWIFNMKNRFSWKDKTETEHSGSISYQVVTGVPDDDGSTD